MDSGIIILGVLALAFGVFSGIARVVKPEWFGKLEAMKSRYGDSTGNTIHFISYVVAPVVVGIVLLIIGVSGGQLLGGGR